jgi:hypothetical protein
MKRVANRDSGVSGGRSHTRPFRDARRFPSTRLYPVLTCAQTTREFGIRPSFKEHFLSPRAKLGRFANFSSLQRTSPLHHHHLPPGNPSRHDSPLCPASPSRGGLPGLAGVTTRPAGYLQRWGTTSCREAAPLTPHAQPGTPAVGYPQLSRGLHLLTYPQRRRCVRCGSAIRATAAPRRAGWRGTGPR